MSGTFVPDLPGYRAAVHDSQVFEPLLDPTNTPGAEVWADSA